MYRLFICIALVIAAVSCGVDAPDGQQTTEPAKMPRAGTLVVLVAPEGFAVDAGSPVTLKRVEHKGRLDADAIQAVLAAASSAQAVLVAPAVQGTAALFAQLAAAGSGALRVAVWPEEDPVAVEAEADLVVDVDMPLTVYGSVRVALSAKASSVAPFPARASGGSYRSKYIQALVAASSGMLGLSYGDSAQGRAALFPVAAHDARAALAAATDACAYIETTPPVGEYGSSSWDPKTYIDDAAKAVPATLPAGSVVIWPWHRADVLASGMLRYLGTLSGTVPGSGRPEEILAVFRALYPVASWQAAWRTDPFTGIRAANHVLLSADPYLPGRGYAPALREGIPKQLRLLSLE